MAKKKYKFLRKLVDESEDPLFMAIKLSIVGNVIDFGTTNRFSIDEMIDNAVKHEFDDRYYPRFKDSLNKSETILFLADNTGEIFFDKLLLEELAKRGKKITYVVKSNPIINDALTVDAKYAGIDKLATVIEGDTDHDISAPGMILSYASKEFLEIFESSDMVISKGQGNYEGLSNVDREVFFMLMVKCPVVAQDMNYEVGNFILKVK
jgi:uncharacterized protein with ATP-grasp and redox domains